MGGQDTSWDSKIKSFTPTLEEAKKFINKINMYRTSMDKNKTGLICPVYLSANGFTDEVEDYLFDNKILTSDFQTWGNK